MQDHIVHTIARFLIFFFFFFFFFNSPAIRVVVNFNIPPPPPLPSPRLKDKMKPKNHFERKKRTPSPIYTQTAAQILNGTSFSFAECVKRGRLRSKCRILAEAGFLSKVREREREGGGGGGGG